MPSNPPQSLEQWEERFNKTFSSKEVFNVYDNEKKEWYLSKKRVEAFIKQERSTLLQQITERVEGKRKEVTKQTSSGLSALIELSSANKCIGFNDAIDEFLELLNSLKEESKNV